jgi:hypothetical protein
MAYGKLGIIKTKGERTVFVLLDENGMEKTIIPDINLWLWERLGKNIDLNITEKFWQITDTEWKEK